jgi:pimeloyl-ACP methyl ester carboxylesterase
VSTASFIESEAKVFAEWSLKPRTRQLRLPKLGTSVRITEVGDGEPALFFHGFSLCSAHMAPLMSRLPSLHSIAIDMPGHGGSDGVDFGGVDLRRWFKEMLTECLDELGLDSAHVVGHSQGAMIGMFLALDAPERVRSLAAIGTPAVALGARIGGLRFLARPVIGRLLLWMPKSAPAYRTILESTIGVHAVEAASPELIRATYLGSRQPGFAGTISSYMREMFKGIDATPPRYVLTDDELARIKQPTLILWGGDDGGYQAIGDAKERASLIPNARFVVVPGGHEPWLEDLDSSMDQISSFLVR